MNAMETRTELSSSLASLSSDSGCKLTGWFILVPATMASLLEQTGPLNLESKATLLPQVVFGGIFLEC